MSDLLQWSDVVPFLTGVASVATASPDGRPHVAIVTPVVVGDTVWIGSYRSSRKVRNLAHNPSIAIVWSPAAEAYVWGRVELVDDVETKRSMWDGTWPYDPAMFFGSPDNPEYVLLHVTPERAMVMTMDETGPRSARWSR